MLATMSENVAKRVVRPRNIVGKGSGKNECLSHGPLIRFCFYAVRICPPNGTEVASTCVLVPYKARRFPSMISVSFPSSSSF